MTERVPVLIYHRVGTPHYADDRTYCITPQRFRAQMIALAAAGYTAIGVDQFVDWLEERDVLLPHKPFVLSFDDGFGDVHQHAWPVLRELGWTATVFLVAGLVGSHDHWMQSNGLARPLTPLLKPAEIGELAEAGWCFQSHGLNHRSLTALAGEALLEEVAGSRAKLQALLGTAVDLFAYPYGHHDRQVVAAVHAAGYRAAFSVQPGFNRRDVDRYRIRRLDVFGNDSPRALLRKLAFGTNDGGLGAVFRYYWTRLRGASA